MQALVGIDDTRQQTPRGGVHPQVGRRRAADDDRRHGEIERGKHLVALSFEHSKGLEFTTRSRPTPSRPSSSCRAPAWRSG